MRVSISQHVTGRDTGTVVAASTSAADSGHHANSVVCLVEADREEDTLAAETASIRFLNGYRGSMAPSGRERLQAGLEAADLALAGTTMVGSVSVTAITVHKDGMDYLAAGEGLIGYHDADGGVIVRSGPGDPRGGGFAEGGIRGKGVRPGSFDLGTCTAEAGADDWHAVLASRLGGVLDDDTLTWWAPGKMDGMAAAEWLAAEIRERTKDRRPGAHVVVIGRTPRRTA